MSNRDELREVLNLLEAEGVYVSIDAGGVSVIGAHDRMSARAVVALATIEGRTAQVRRVLAEAAALSPEDRARLDREHEELAAMRAAKPAPAPELATSRCPNGHLRTEATAYARVGHGHECKKCRCDRVREAKAKQRAAKAKAKAARKRPGPPPRERCLHGGHLLTPDNVYTSKVTHRRRCRECTRIRDRARRKRGRKNYYLSAPTAPVDAPEARALAPACQPPVPTLFQEVER